MQNFETNRLTLQPLATLQEHFLHADKFDNAADQTLP